MTKPGNYFLSIQSGKKVKHYPIMKLDKGGHYITHRAVFSTLKELVEYYTKSSYGLCCNLRMALEKPQIDLSHLVKDLQESPRKSITLLSLLCNDQFNSGVVYEGLWNNTTPVAVKALKSGNMAPQDFLEEAHIMKKLHHPKLIQLYIVT